MTNLTRKSKSKRVWHCLYGSTKTLRLGVQNSSNLSKRAPPAPPGNQPDLSTSPSAHWVLPSGPCMMGRLPSIHPADKQQDLRLTNEPDWREVKWRLATHTRRELIHTEPGSKYRQASIYTEWVFGFRKRQKGRKRSKGISLGSHPSPSWEQHQAVLVQTSHNI